MRYFKIFKDMMRKDFMNTVKNIINPFDDVKLKKELQIRLPGYGEKRSKRTCIYLEDTIYKKTIAKCRLSNCTINEAINQLLYIWSKGININEIKNDGKNHIVSESAYHDIFGFDKKRDKAVNLAIEPTIYAKSMYKSKREGYTLIDAVNKILFIWTQDDEETEDNNVNNEKNNQNKNPRRSASRY